MAAEHVARERGTSIGELVGYSIRFDHRCGPKTRLRFATPGTVLQRLQNDPNLQQVSVLVFDEFHERHVDDDTLLAWALHLQKNQRPDLRIVVMSATLNPAPLSALLQCPVVRSEGRLFPVDIQYHRREDPRPLPVQVAATVRRIQETNEPGDILVFLPGLRSIERVVRACQSIPTIQAYPLHGGSSLDETRAALAPNPKARKVIAATNVAESSLTIPGITTVIDSGLHKVARSSPWTGLTSLREEPISQHSANQRAGRAGRLSAGQCIRLYTETDYRCRPQSLAPEIQRIDLAPLALRLRSLGVEDLPWLDPPPTAQWSSAHSLLSRLGALDTGVTALGEQVLSLPLHPRLGRLALAAPHWGPVAAAVLSEGTRLPDSAQDSESDVLALIEHHGQRRQIRKVTRDIQKRMPPNRVTDDDPATTLRKALLQAFPDRVCRRRKGDPQRLTMVSGAESRLAPKSTVRQEEWLVAVEATDRHVRLASAIDPEWLLDLPGAEDQLTESVDARWLTDRERVELRQILRWCNLPLEDSTLPARGRPEADALLQRQARIAGLGRFCDADALTQYRERRIFAHTIDAMVPALDEQAILSVLDTLCVGKLSFREIREADLLGTLQGQLSWPQKQQLDSLAPERLSLASGRDARVRYVANAPPRLSAPVQWFLGMNEGPKLGTGRGTALLELLAPNRRPIQLTDDLAGFWTRTWPQVRKELRGRYAKHAWPEDPTKPPPKRRR